MKIGILTFHCAHNYGAVLQCYALQEFLKAQGEDVEIIDYRPKSLTRSYKIFPKFSMVSHGNIYSDTILFAKCIISYTKNSILSFPVRRKRIKLFNNFINNRLNLSNRRYDKAFSKNRDYDLYIIGSDQVWNAKFNNNILDSVFWGNFKTKDNAKVISYAASNANYQYSDLQKRDIKNYLLRFNAISVREDSLQEYLESTLNIQSNIVLDPTLIAERSIWDKIAKERETTNKYLLAYIVEGGYDATLKNAKETAKRRGLDFILINNGKTDSNNGLGNTFSIEEFIGLIKNAECVICSSFHGLAFSIIYEKDFYYLTQNMNNARAISLLNKIGALDRFISNSKADLESIKPLDYSVINKKLLKYKNESIEYINNSLKTQ